MTDRLAPAQRSALMAKIQGGPNNKLQRSIHGWLCAKHVRHTCEPKILGAGRPDFAVYPREGQRIPILLVFVDGCFWHGCPWHFRLPATREAYWRGHIDANRARDARRRDLPFPYTELWEHGVTGAPGWPKGAYKAALWARIRLAYDAHGGGLQGPLDQYVTAGGGERKR